MHPKKKLFLIDGSGFIFRAYHALPPLTRSDGVPIGAVYGFCNMLSNLLENLREHYVAVVFDSSRKNFRHTIYPLYKANRSEAPEDLLPQFPLMREACEAFSVPIIEMEGYEADDLIAAYAEQAEIEGFYTTIISSDKDLMQLVNENVVLFDHMKNRFLKEKEVEEKFGVPPNKVIDVQALAGDASDNIPGVVGIGPKIAAELINRFGSLDNLFNNLEEIKQPKRRQNLIEFQDLAYISKQLVTLKTSIPLPIPIPSLKMTLLDLGKLSTFLEAQGFLNLKKRIFKDLPAQSGKLSTFEQQMFIYSGPGKILYHVMDSLEKIDALERAIYRRGFCALDTETTSLDPLEADLIGISISINPGEAYYFPYQKGAHNIDYGEAFYQKAHTFLDKIASDETLLKVGHNIKYDLHILQNRNIFCRGIEDTIIIAGLLEFGPYNLDALVLKHFNYNKKSFKDLLHENPKAQTFKDISLEAASFYACEDADYTLQLYFLFLPKLVEGNLIKVYKCLEKPLIPIIQKIEWRGILIDPDVLQNLSHKLSKDLHALEEQIYRMAGEQFNIGSPKQLAHILFEILKLPHGKKGKSGGYSTDIEVLEDLAYKQYPIAQKILEWRRYSKLKSTYTDALLKQINPTTGRIHTNFNQVTTNTGRLASSQPNLQNIPIKTSIGREVRRAFITAPGYQLLSFDYSQIELRVLAYMAQIDTLQSAFYDKKDIHALTASQILNIPLETVTLEQRRKAKAINFGIIYGISAYGLAKQLNISRGDAQKYIEQYHIQYPGIKKYMQQYIEFAQQHGFVETLYGRKCFIQNISHKNPTLRNFAERQAINAPIQGTAADIIKIAMLKVSSLLKDFPQVHVVLQVHDELLLEAPNVDVDYIKKSVCGLMSSIDGLNFPLVVDVGSGNSWYDAHT